MSRSPLLLAGANSFVGVALLLIGILIPVSVCRRWVRDGRMILTVFLLLAAFFAILQSASYAPGFRGVLIPLIGAAMIVVPFWKGDLLAAVAAAFGSGAGLFAANLASQTAPSVRVAALQIAIALLAVAVIATLGALRGRELAIDAARPEYARNIAERLTLQGEIDAARQAQLRVVPQTIPAVGGLEIAAECRAARRVSGDYYDFIQAGPRQVKVTVAGGEHLPLSSALAATAAKGMLFVYSHHGLTPDETVRNVQRHVASIFGDPLPFSLLYASLDTDRGTLEYAMLGTSVQMLLLGANEPPRWVRPIADASAPVASGSVRLHPGDRIVMTTRGVLNAQNQEDEPFGEQGVLLSAGSAEGGAAGLLRATMSGAAAHARGTDPHDDWTAVALAVTDVAHAAPAAEEVLA